MRFSKYVLMTVMSSLALLIGGIHAGKGATNVATATVTLKVNFMAPPCTITTPAQVLLGSMTTGTQNHPPFSVQIDCPTVTKTALYAEVVGGTLNGNDRVNMTGPENTGTAAQLWLTGEDGKNVVLDGSGSTDKDVRFCDGEGSNRSCTLTPHTQVASDTPRGTTTATLRLSVAYP